MSLQMFNNILYDLKSHKRDKSELLTCYVQTRLDTSLNHYYDSLQQSITFLMKKDEKRIAKLMR